jgi:hypothetical protein
MWPCGWALSGSADNIKSQITTGSQWQPLANGVEAKNAADKGLFVLGALAGYEQVVKDSDGHVVVVVSGPLAHSAYPTAYWGSVAVGVAAKYQTVNYAWAKADRDRVHYACWRPSAT